MSMKTLLAGLGLAAVGMGAVTADAASLPQAYSRREWIQSTGNQYIKIDYWHTATTRVELACHIPKPTSGSYPVMFGSRNANAGSCAYYFAARFFGANCAMFCLTGNEGRQNTTTHLYDEDIIIRTDGATKTATWENASGEGGSVTTTGTAGNGLCSWTLFWLNKATSRDGVTLDDGGSTYKFYSMKIYEGETLVCDLVPVMRQSDEVAGVYDLQRDCFFANGKPENPFKVGDPYAGDLAAVLTVPDDTTVDGIHTLQGASVSVTNSKTGETLVEGTDYTVAWGDLSAPGTQEVLVTGETGTPYEGATKRLTFETKLAPDARRPYLPAGYTEVDWVSSTLGGNQWVNTGVVHTPTTEVTCVCFAESKLNGMQYGSLFGSRNGSYQYNCYCYFVRFNGASCYSRTGNEKTGSTFLFDKLVTVSTLNATATVTDGTTTNTITTTGTLDEGKSPFLLFCHNNAGSATGASPGDHCVAKIYSFVMCEGDVKACWLVPCYRNSDGAVGFYDVAHLCEGDGGFRPNGAATALTKGVDIIRPAKADETLDFFRTGGEATFVDFIYSVNDAALVGAAATLEWADNAEFTDASRRDLGASAAYLEEVSGRIEGLRAGKTYYLRLTLRKGGRADVVRSFSFETPSAAGVIADSVDISWVSGRDPEFTGTVLVFGAGETHRVELHFSEDGETFEKASELDVAAAGTFTITGVWPAYFKPVKYKLVYVTDDGTSVTSVRERNQPFSATYTWKGAVTEGDWTNAANWTISGASVTNPTELYPQRDGYHIVTFPENKAVTVNLYGGEAFWYVNVGKNACVTLKGDGATPVTLNGGSFRISVSGFSLILDNVAFVQSNSGGATQSGTDNMGANSGIRLQNGSSFMKDGGGWPVNFVSSGDRLELVGGSTLTFVNNVNYFRFYSPDSVVLIDDSVFSCNVPIHLNDAASDWTIWRFAGEGPLLEAKGGCSVQGAGGAKLVFDAPKGGFSAAPLKVTGGMLATCNGPVEISVPDKAQVWKGSTCTFPLIDAPSGINTNSVTLSTGRRTNGTFIWTTTEGVANPTGLKFKARVNGTVLFVR